MDGKVHGGQSPVQGALVKLWHTDSTATSYGATGILIGTAISDVNGAFSIGSNSGSSASTTNCPAGAQAYITAAGGYTPGQPTAINNNMLQMAALGDCATVNSNTFVLVDEITTVAAAYALSNFMTTSLDGSNTFYQANVSAPIANNAMNGSATVTNPSGLAHAFINAAKLASSTTGFPNATVTASSGGGTIFGSVPAVEINTLADMMQACVNTVSGMGGAITSIPVASGGSGYGATLTITGGFGAGATGNAVVSSSGVVTALSIANAGSGYSPTLTISGNGSGGVLIPTIAGGALNGATIENGGSGYGALATVSPSTGFPAGSGASLAASSTAGVPTSYTVLNGGSGYGPLVTVTAPPYAGGTTASVNAQIATSTNAGMVSQLQLVSGGSGYGPLVSFTAASGSGAVIAATLSGSNGAVTALAVTSSGSGYPVSTTFPLTITAPPGSGLTAMGTATSSATGTISTAVLLNGGSGYTLPTLTISAPPGGGTAATGSIASVKAGAVLGFTYTANGSGYTMPTVAISGTGTGGNAYINVVTGGKITGVGVGLYGVSGNAGSGYGPTLTVQAPPSGGTQAVATANVSAGTISLVSVSNAGAGYSPTVTITGGTTNATGTAMIAGGVVTALNLATAGSGYNVPTVTIAAPPGGGTTATATAATSGGLISNIHITSGGSGYSSAPAVTISAPVSGTTATAGTAVLTANAGSGSTAPAPLCNTLFTLTPSISGVLPTNTLQAYINLARNPYPSAAAMNSSTGLFSLLSGSPAFQPTLTSAGLPADWSLSIVYGTTASGNSTALALPYYTAMDANDTVYLSRSSTSTTTPLLYGVSTYGAAVPLFANATASGNGRGLAIDQLGNIWATSNASTLYQVNVGTGALTNSYTTVVGSMTDVKVDAANNVWISNAIAPGTNLEQFAYTPGSPDTWTPNYTASLPAGPNGIAIDANQNVWASTYATSGGTTIGTYATVFANTGTTSAPNYNAQAGVITPVQALFGGGASRPYGVALDASGNAWFSIYGGASASTSGVEEVVPNSASSLSSLTPGEFILGSSFSPNGNQLGTAVPALPAIDGAGTMFIPDDGIFDTPVTYGLHIYSTITGNTLSPANGITSCMLATSSTTSCGTTTGGAIYEPRQPVVDSTGSVWVGLIGPSSTGGVTQIIGVAAPAYPVLSIGKPGLSPGLTTVNPLP
jgi:hypothetical protein